MGCLVNDQLYITFGYNAVVCTILINKHFLPICGSFLKSKELTRCEIILEKSEKKISSFNYCAQRLGTSEEEECTKNLLSADWKEIAMGLKTYICNKYRVGKLECLFTTR